MSSIRGVLRSFGRRIHTAATELRRRRVWKVAGLYFAGAFVVWQVADIVVPALGAPGWIMSIVIWATLAGFPLALALAWLFDVTPEGIERSAPGEIRVPSPKERPAVVPAAATPLVGRDRELESVRSFLTDPTIRLISIVGPGGVGKTRLAIAAVQSLSNSNPGDVRFVPLDEVPPDEGRLLPELATALGLRVVDPTVSELATALDEPDTVLVLDGLPSSDEAAGLVTGLLEGAPGLTVLRTSYSPLGVRAEHVIGLQGLVSDDEGSERAVQLFLAAARRLSPTFSPSDEERRQIREICTAVGGLPLAIELVAAWTDVLSLPEILDEVEQGRHLQLESPHADTPSRQQSLTTVAHASLTRLPEQVRQTARAMAVFSGVFSADAARAVAGATPDLLKALLQASFIHREADDRFRMHRVLAEHARESWTTSERESIRRRHSDYFLEYARKLWGTVAIEPDRALARFTADRDDLEAAWRYAAEEGRWQEVDASIDALFGLADLAGALTFAHVLFGVALDRTERDGTASAALCSRLLIRRGRIRHRLGRLSDALQDLTAGLERLPEGRLLSERATALNGLGDVTAALGRYEEAYRFCEEALEVFRAAEDRGGIGVTHMNLGVIDQSRFRYDEARAHHAESLAVAREIGDHRTVANGLINLGALQHDLGNLEEAAEHYGQALQIAQELADTALEATALANLGRVAYRQKDFQSARTQSREALEIFRASGDELGAVAALLNLADAELALGREETAERLFIDALEPALRREVTPLVGEAILGLADLRQKRGQTEQAVALLAPTSQCAELDPEAIARRDQLIRELAPDRDFDDAPSLRQVALAILDSSR